MDHTSRMATLLQQMCRQRNGAVADSMRFYGRSCGLNYGVSLATVRQIAREENPDHDFASYLFLQDVRELRLAALHIAQPHKLTVAQFEIWGAGIINSEIAEESAFALLSRSDVVNQLFSSWIESPNPLLVYSALLSAARAKHPHRQWIDQAADTFLRSFSFSEDFAQHIIAQGIVSLYVALASHDEQYKKAINQVTSSFAHMPCGSNIIDELAWRIE